MSLKTIFNPADNAELIEYFGTFKNDEWSQLNWEHMRQFESPPAP
jgi:hypothetical protein